MVYGDNKGFEGGGVIVELSFVREWGKKMDGIM